jgi:hypothetical protein
MPVVTRIFFPSAAALAAFKRRRIRSCNRSHCGA